jgi:hypothetical protein
MENWIHWFAGLVGRMPDYEMSVLVHFMAGLEMPWWMVQHSPTHLA